MKQHYLYNYKPRIPFFYLCSSLLKVHGLKNSSGVHRFGEHGKPNGKELVKAWIPNHCYRCVPGVLQGGARAGRSGRTVKSFTSILFYLISSHIFVFHSWWFFFFLQIVDNPAEVADKADRIITMLPSSPNVVDVYTGSSGILKYTSSSIHTCMWLHRPQQSHFKWFFSPPLYRKVKKGSLLIDSSTIDPSVSKEMAAAAEKMGAVFMDAPVSGGTFYLVIYFLNSYIMITFHFFKPLPSWN